MELEMIGIIKRAYIVFVGCVMVLLLALMSEHNWEYVYQFVFWALIGTPIVAYIFYRVVKFIFYGK